MLKKSRFVRSVTLVFLCAALTAARSSAAPVKLSETKDPEIFDLIKKAPTREDNANSAVYLLLEEEDIVKKDGSAVRMYHAVVKLLKGAASGLGEAKIPFDSSYQTVQLNMARTIRRDGTIVEVQKAAVQDKSPYADFPMYSNILIRQISFPALEEECVVEYRYTVTEKSILRKSFKTYFAFPWGFEVNLARLKISVPNELKARYVTQWLYESTKPKITADGDKTVYQWEMKDIFWHHSFELQKSPYKNNCSYILFSTTESWDDVSGWFCHLTQDQANPDGSIADLVGELMKGKDGEEEKIKALYYYVSQEIRYVAIELGLAAWRPQPASDVLKYRYGDCKGKAALLIAMLKAINVPAYFTLVKTADTGKLDDIPALDFNHCIVAIPKNGSYVFLDATAGMCRYGRVPFVDEGTRVLVVDGAAAKLVDIPLSDGESNKMISDTVMMINPDKTMSCTTKTLATGTNEMLMRLTVNSMHPQELRYLSEQGLSQVYPGARLTDLKIPEPKDMNAAWETTSTYTIKGYLEETTDGLNFRLPDTLMFSRQLTSADHREYPIWFPCRVTQEIKILIKAPPGYKVKSVPKEVKLDYPFASYAQDCFIREDAVQIIWLFNLKEREISNNAYWKFKQFSDELAKAAKQNIVFEKMTQ